jgi:Fe2+ transport system protein B
MDRNDDGHSWQPLVKLLRGRKALQETWSTRLRLTVQSGIRQGWNAFLWILKILVPLSFLTALLEFSGWTYALVGWLKPVMGWLSLPPEAALPIITGLLIGIYGGIGVIATLPFTADQMTLIAVFLLIAHNLIQEGIIQGKSGIHIVKITVIRLLVAVVAVVAVARFLGSDTTAPLTGGTSTPAVFGFIQALKHWSSNTAGLCLKMLFIIMIVMLVMEGIRIFRLTDRALEGLEPLLRIMGLDKKVGLLWMTGAFFGIAYGGAVIVQEARRESFTHEAIEKLHLSIGVNHSVIEDPALFLSFGLSPFWLWVPRLIAAVIIVYVVGLRHRSGRLLTRLRSMSNK